MFGLCLRKGEQTLPLLSHNASDTSGNGSARPEAERDTHVLFFSLFAFCWQTRGVRLSRILKRNRSRGAGEFNNHPAHDFPTSKKKSRKKELLFTQKRSRTNKQSTQTKQNKTETNASKRGGGKSAVCQVVVSRVRATYPRFPAR